MLRVVVSAPLGNALHAVRREEELTGKLWAFTPLAGDRAGETFPVAVPSCRESYPAFGNYRGEGRYSTRFTGGGNLRFVFRGVSHTARVFLDGVEIARHYNAYTPFEAVVRGAAEGEHTLEIVADNRFSEESALHVPNDYMSYGGVTRAVSVERIGSAYVRSVHVTPECVGGKWRAHVRVCVVNLGERAPMSVEVGAAGGRSSRSGRAPCPRARAFWKARSCPRTSVHGRPRRPRTMNNKGVFDEYRRLKLCAEVVKKIFRET